MVEEGTGVSESNTDLYLKARLRQQQAITGLHTIGEQATQLGKILSTPEPSVQLKGSNPGVSRRQVQYSLGESNWTSWEQVSAAIEEYTKATSAFDRAESSLTSTDREMLGLC